METLVLRIPEDLAADLEEEARRLNSTKSAVARARLTAAKNNVHTSESGFGLIADLIGVEKGGRGDMARRKKHYLKVLGYGREKPRR